jgi:hypothetical protein
MPMRRQITPIFRRLLARQYVPDQAFGITSYIGIVQAYKTALASIVFNAFVRAICTIETTPPPRTR